jgi:hypothetical protein
MQGMKADNKTILAQLTENQISLLVKTVQLGLRPSDATENDIAGLLGLGLFERPEIGYIKDASSGLRESSAALGVPVPSEFGRAWVTWHLANHS